MGLTTGTRLGPYEVVAAVGMGEVCRARDTKRNLDVALKVLLDAFVRDRERIARFEREAQLLAFLSHPRIAAIYRLAAGGSRLAAESREPRAES
jgi:serine/threonine protein kinase